ncbi:alpha-galactosidase [Frondihabitans sp. PhB188]|uniref:alpha-galactosidase n=1 Tax=Frondihabitans sp. PhB188 TaxID=2485200 RepID=UPI000F47D511|nr:alpha-galactosidase [Frondihabitans sp. PhB188]ROQ40800.1 alpha-galactosidase [Frondihabitans sp. PhB188]
MPKLVHLRSSGVSLLVDIADAALPAIVHWGADLGELTRADAEALVLANVEARTGNIVDDPIRLALVPEQHVGWAGKPGVAGNRDDGSAWAPAFTPESSTLDGVALDGAALGVFVEVGAGLLVVEARDTVAGLLITVELELLASGLVRARATLLNEAPGLYRVQELNLAFPVPPRAKVLLDFAGRWGKERVPQRNDFAVGIHEREGRKGRTGADAATVLSAGVPGFGFRRGEVWGVHTAFSGNHRHYAERLFTGAAVVGGGEFLLPGEIRLEQGGAYRSPWVYAAYGDGLDDQAARFHRWLRSREQHPTRPRPMTLNVWEAVYFDHDLGRLTDLADRAAQVGVERYVLDDGWFRGRRDDTRGLGDWYVDEGVWPDGLGPLIDHVNGLGMEFGLWFEPEMISEDSDLARAHPEWILQTADRLPVRARSQQVLNLGIPEAFDHILERMSALLDEYAIAYIKWDHNRDLFDAGTPPVGAPGVHAQTLAAYALMDELKRRHPGLEIEACASGGGRVDLGVIERTDRVWVSDCIDPLERQDMNRWSMQLLPPELLGSHIGSGVSHTTGRAHPLSFRAGTAIFGHFGIEWDLRQAQELEMAELTEWVALYKRSRALMHTGVVVRSDTEDPTLNVYGAVAGDRSEALFFVAFTGTSITAPAGRFVLPGLDPAARYRVEPILIGEPEPGLRPPSWWPGVDLPGAALASAGLQAPMSFPERVIPLRVTRLP